MNRRTATIAGVLAVLVLAGEWAVLRTLYAGPTQASIECHASNAGLPLAREQVRVLVYPFGRPFELVADGFVDEPLAVPPGRYDIRLLLDASADQQSEWFRDVEVTASSRVVKHAVFDAGQLSVVSAVESPTEAGELIAYVFVPDDHDRIITSVRPDEPALLASGVYDLRAVFVRESEERGVTWLRGISVDAGAQTQVEVPFERGRLIVTARNAGEILARETVTMTVFAAGDTQQEVVDWGNASTALSLERGRYDVELIFARSNDKASRWLRDIEIAANETLEQAVDFSSGSVQIDATMAGGEPLREFAVYVYYYRAGDHREPVAYTPGGEAAMLESGLYDVRIQFFRSHDRPDAWLRRVEVKPGQRVTYGAQFQSGRLLVRAHDAARRELIGDDVFLYVHDVHPPGVTSRPLVIARTGEELILSAGRYDLRLVDTRTAGPARWLRDVAVQPGDRTELSVSIGSERPEP